MERRAFRAIWKKMHGVAEKLSRFGRLPRMNSAWPGMEAVDLNVYRKMLQSEVNRTLRRGSLWACVLALLSGGGIALLIYTGAAERMETPLFWTLICAVYAGLVYCLARANLVGNRSVYPIMLGFTSLPAILYLLGYFLLPSGAATYITGPPSYLFFCMIIVSGFAFDARLATFAGALAGAEYMLVYWLSAPYLRQLAGPDPLLLQDLTEMPIYLFKALMMLFSGIFVGTIATTARRLLSRIISEEREKSSIADLFGQYVSDEVKDRIVAERAGIVGETRSLALLFCDIRGFTALSENQSPENIVLQLNEYFDAMGDSITRESGTIDKFIGDAIMAYFGGLVLVERPCDHAFRAATGMQAALQELNQRRARRGLPALENGIGLHFGPVLQGSIGSKDRKNYSVIGDSVNTAARIEGLCSPRNEGLLVSGEFYRELLPENQARCRALGEVSVKGKSQAIELYAVT